MYVYILLWVVISLVLVFPQELINEERFLLVILFYNSQNISNKGRTAQKKRRFTDMIAFVVADQSGDFRFYFCSLHAGYSSSENEEITPVGAEMRIIWLFDLADSWF